MQQSDSNRRVIREWHKISLSVVAGLLAMGLLLLADMPERALRQASERLDMLGKASSLRARLESQLNEHLRITEALAGLMSVRGELGDEEFRAVAAALQRQAPAMRNLGVTSGTTIRQVYPLEGNQAIVGVRYQDLPTQWPQVEQAIRERSSILAGPVRLVQGGNGLIERTPVFAQDDQRFLGLVSLVLNSDELFRLSGLLEDPTMDIALARAIPLSATSQGLETFYGRAGLVDEQPIILPIRMLGAEWQMLAVPRGGWEAQRIFHPLRLVVQAALALLIMFGSFALLGHVQRLRLALRDIAAKEHRLKTAQSVARMGDMEWAAASREMQCSEQLYAILGMTPESGPLRTEDFWRAVHADDQDALAATLQQVLQNGSTASITVRLWTTEGELCWAQMNLQRMPGNRLFATLTDVTVRQREDEERRRMLTRLRRSNEDLEQFTWIASHHLQEPLRMIGSYLQLLERRYQDRLDDDALAFIDFAAKGAQRLQNLLIDLLAYTRLTAEQGLPETVDTAAVVEQVRLGLAGALELAGADLEIGFLPPVIGWRDQLAAVFQHLISNAIQYRAFNRPLQIRIAAEKQGQLWEFRVADNGTGIDPLFHGQIFKIFRRLSNDYEGHGTGMGLALCLRVVEHHGGTLQVESQVDQGATFIFTLPGSGRQTQAL